MKKGLAITTFNSESYFKELYDTIPFSKIDQLVVVNGGEEYTGSYPEVTDWIQHKEVKFASIARNDGLRAMEDCDYLFVCEDDMVVKDENIFDRYIEVSNASGLEYLCHASNAWETGPPHNRTPRLQIQYTDNIAVNLYTHTCNEFTFRTKNLLDKCGLYDEKFKFMFDIDSLTNMNYHEFIKFWYFPDVADSDNYIMNNPNAISRMNANGERAAQSVPYNEMFIQKWGHHIGGIPEASRDEVIEFLKNKKINRRSI